MLSILLVVMIHPANAEHSVRIDQSITRTTQSSFRGDHLDLVLSKHEAEVDRLYFVSSYGCSEAQIVKDTKDRAFVLLTLGLGRGTNARREYLGIYQVIHDRLEEVARIPTGGPSGPTTRWKLEYKLLKPKQGGIEIHFTSPTGRAVSSNRGIAHIKVIR